MDWVIEFMENWGYLAFFIMMALENMNIPIPSELILGFAGFLVSQNVFSFWPAVIIGTLAGIFGSLISYWIGYYGGRPFIIRYGRFFFLGGNKLHAAELWFKKYGGIAVFTGRLIPGIRTFISLPAGIARYPLKPFLIYTILGTIPWTILFIWGGSVLGTHWRKIMDYDQEVLIAIGILFVIALISYGWWVHHKKKSNKNLNKYDNLEN